VFQELQNAPSTIMDVAVASVKNYLNFISRKILVKIIIICN